MLALAVFALAVVSCGEVLVLVLVPAPVPVPVLVLVLGTTK